MKPRDIGIIGLILLLSISNMKAQGLKHQVGINASRFIVLFNEQVNNLDLSYRYGIDSLYSLRSAISLDVTSAEEGISDMALRLGIDRHFKVSNKWRYYVGIEGNYARTLLKSSERTNRNYGAFLFVGFLFNIGQHFSLSTEPTLSLLRYQVRDDNDFGPNANRNWSEVKLINIGQIKMSFHF